MERFSPNQVPTFHVEHLATFSTTQHEHVTPRMALQRLFKMEKTSGIWTQRMAIQLKANHMWILDGETNDVVERFPVALIQQPTSFNDQNHIYNNILIFTVQLPNESQGELHIFQCVSHDAVNVVDDIYQWMRHYGITPSSPSTVGEKAPASNVNVKEAVTVFNQIAAQREKKGASSDSIHRLPQGHQDIDSRSDSSSFAESNANNNPRNGDMNESFSNERYVSILNHCFDDIERFIIRLQHAAAALRELQIRSHKRGAKGSGDGLLAIRARGPTEEEFFEILSKFKLAFNLLAKLKGCIHDPNAPELVHFLFTPLAIIIEAARSNEPPVDPSLVGIPYLSNDAVELLSNCCTSKEYDLWQSLGLNWAQSVKHLRLTSPYQPIFTDGWAPSITEPELIGIATPMSESEHDSDEHQIPIRHSNSKRDSRNEYARAAQYEDSDDYEDNNVDNRISNPPARGSPSTSHGNRVANTSPSPIESLERESPNGAHGIDSDQLDWVADLQARNAKIVRVLFPRTANNNKELTVSRGEILEVLDDSRKWWKARNSRGQTAHVPNTIVSEVEALHVNSSLNHQLRDPASSNDDWIRRERQDEKVVDVKHKVFSIKRAKIAKHNKEIKPTAENTLSKQLNQRFQDGLAINTGFQDEFNKKLNTLTEANINVEDLIQLLKYKEFSSKLIQFIEKILKEKRKNCIQLLNCSKGELRFLISKDIEDFQIHRLYSNFVLILNSIKPQIESELSSILEKRKVKIEDVESIVA